MMENEENLKLERNRLMRYIAQLEMDILYHTKSAEYRKQSLKDIRMKVNNIDKVMRRLEDERR